MKAESSTSVDVIMSTDGAEDNIAKEQLEEMTIEETGKSLYEKLNELTSSLPFAHALLVLNVILYGGFCVIGPMSINQFPPVLYAAFRTGTIAFTVLPLALVFDRGYKFRDSEQIGNVNNWVLRYALSRIPSGKLLLLCLAAGIIAATNIGTYITSMGLISPTIVSIISPLSTVFTCVIAVLLKKEGKSVLKFAGVFLAVLGSMATLIFAAFFDKSSQSDKDIAGSTKVNIKSILACSLMLVNTLGTATLLNIQKVLLDRGIPPLTLTGYTLSVATVIMGAVGAFFMPQFDPKSVTLVGWIGLAYGGIIVGSVSFVIMGYASKIASATIVSVYGTSMPVVSALFLYVFLRETISWMIGIGGVIIMSGVVMVAFGRRQEVMQEQKLKEQAEQQDSSVEEQELVHADAFNSVESTEPISHSIAPEEEPIRESTE